MIAGLCENPLTFQALIIWRDELNEGNILLRDIIDLEATYAGPEAKQAPAVPAAADDEALQQPAEEEEKKPEKQIDPLTGEEIETEDDEDDDEDDEDMEASLSLAAMEAELKPQIFETLNSIAGEYKKLRRLQDQLVEKALGNKTLSPAQERRYKELHDSIVQSVKSLSLNNNRLKRWLNSFTRSTRTCSVWKAVCCALRKPMVCRVRHSWKSISVPSLIPTGSAALPIFPPMAGKSLTRAEGKQIKEIRSEIQDLAGETGLQPSEFRRIVHKVQKVSAKHGRPRKKWSKQTFVSLFPSPRNIQTVVCNFLISFRKATSA